MNISLFDIIGPITVGPSSSHTAGAVRIGLICRLILGEEVRHAKVMFYGSFADTYKGHGTDKAIIGGLLGFGTGNARIRESLQLAQFRGMKYEFITCEDERKHPNTVRIEASSKHRSVKLVGISVGGGAIKLVELNGFDVEATCFYDTLIIFHKDVPGILANIAHTLSHHGYNIGNLRLSRTKRDGDVITIIETDAAVSGAVVRELRKAPSVADVVSVPRFSDDAENETKKAGGAE